LLRDSEGLEVELQAEVGRGGEGTVHEVAGRAGTVAKVYAKPPPSDKVEKLALMIERFEEHPELAWWCAWPESLLADDVHACRGFLMRKVADQHPVHDVYSPEQRKALAPDVGWDFLVRIAANVARMFASLDGFGVIVDDVNERNLLVGLDATVTFVDCDSFQVATRDHVFASGVGVPDYTPPELQGSDFRTAIRSLDHDRFGLAVLLFKLLFMGRHPFSGGATGDLGAAIRARSFDYPQLQHQLPHLVPFDAVPPPVRELFRAALTSDGSQPQPDADAWVEALAAFERDLRPCGAQPLHFVPSHLPQCPWCRIEAALKYAYFADPSAQPWQSQYSVDLARLASATERLDAVPPPIAPDQWTPPLALDEALRALQLALSAQDPPDIVPCYVHMVGGLAVLAGLAHEALGGGGRWLVALGMATVAAGIVLGQNRQRPARAIRQARLALRDELLRSGEVWKGDAASMRQADRRLRSQIADLVERWRDLDRRHADELERLQGDRVPPECLPVLRRVSLERTQVPGLPPDRKQALLVRGLITAADLDRAALRKVPGLQPQHVDAVVAWRQALEHATGAPRRLTPTRGQLSAVDANSMHLQEELADQVEALCCELDASNRAADEKLQAAYTAIERRARDTAVGLQARG
jgi:DNA-binding helix-hairpin-helix protein with protein kinase domain